MSIKPIGITMGDSSGVGPEILLQAVRQQRIPKPFVVFGDRAPLALLNERLALGVDLGAIGLIVAGTVMILWPAPGPDSGLPEFVRNAWLRLNETPLYKILFTYVVFGANLFYLLAIASVFVLRRARPDAHRPYRTWGYPFTPSIFVIASVYLLQDMLRQSPAESLAGVGIILAGIPAYLIFSRSSGAKKPYQGTSDVDFR